MMNNEAKMTNIKLQRIWRVKRIQEEKMKIKIYKHKIRGTRNGRPTKIMVNMTFYRS